MGLYYSRLCLQAPVLSHIVRRNIALQRLARAISPFLQVPGEPPAFSGSVQDLELVTRAEAQVLCSPSLVIKQSHEVVAMASPGLLTLHLGRIRGAAGPWVLNHHHRLVGLLEQAGETGLQESPQPQTNVAHGALVGRRGEGLLPLPSVSADPLSRLPPGNVEVSTNSLGFRECKGPASQQRADLPAVIPAWEHTPACFLWPELLPQSKNEWELGGCLGEEVLSSCLLRNPTAKLKLRGLYSDKCLRTEESSCFMSREKVPKRKR